MEKITIKINHVALEVLCNTFDEGGFQRMLTQEQKVVMSIISDLSLQLEKKEINKRHTTKKFKMTFKYYEAFAFEASCRMYYNNFNRTDIYGSHVALDIANQIDQQL